MKKDEIGLKTVNYTIYLERKIERERTRGKGIRKRDENLISMVEHVKLLESKK